MYTKDCEGSRNAGCKRQEPDALASWDKIWKSPCFDGTLLLQKQVELWSSGRNKFACSRLNLHMCVAKYAYKIFKSLFAMYLKQQYSLWYEKKKKNHCRTFLDVALSVLHGIKIRYVHYWVLHHNTADIHPPPRIQNAGPPWLLGNINQKRSWNSQGSIVQ